VANAGGANVAGFVNALNATVIKFKDGTDATKLLAFDLSGITTATTRTLTVPNKSGTIATFADVGLTPIATITPTAAAFVDFLSTFSGSYDNYLIIGQGLAPSATDTLVLRLATGGAADANSVYFNINVNGPPVTTPATSSGNLTNSIPSTGGLGFSLLISNVNDATRFKRMHLDASYQIGTPSYQSSATEIAYTAANTVSGLRLYWSSGANFQAVGKVRVYGFN
jgi:hypothetical protein